MNRRHRDMERIDARLRRQAAAGKQPFGQQDGVLCDFEDCCFRECRKPAGRCIPVTGCGFVENEL